MKQFAFFLVSVLLVALPSPFLLAQKRTIKANELLELSGEIYRRLHRPGERQIVSFEGDGKIIRQWSQSADRIFEGELPFYQSEQTQLELELTGQQQNRYQKIMTQWKSERNKQVQSLEKKGKQKENLVSHKEIMEKLNSMASERKEEILDLLTRRQRLRLGQLRFRFLIRTYGMLVVLKQEKVLRFLNSNEIELEALNSQWNRRMEEIRLKMFSAQKQAIETAYEPLSDDQRKALFEKWPYLTDKKNPQIDRLRIQLQFYDEYKSLEKFKNPFCKIDRFPVFEVDFSGLMNPEEMTFDIEKEDEGYHSARIVFQLFESGKLDELELSGNQETLLQVFHEEFKLAAVLAQKLAIQAKPKTEMERNIAWLQSRSVRKSTGDKIMKRIDNMLIPRQRKEFKTVPVKALARQYGPSFDLINGPLGESIKLSESQKRSLKKSFKEAVKQLDEKTIELEEFWIQESFQLLGKTKKRLLLQLVGPKLLETPPILSNYLHRIEVKLN